MGNATCFQFGHFSVLGVHSHEFISAVCERQKETAPTSMDSFYLLVLAASHSVEMVVVLLKHRVLFL